MELKGSIVAIVTPFREGRIDEAAFERLVEFQIAEGTQGIVPCGTTGESATQSHAEHEDLVKKTVKLVKGRVPVIAGTGSNCTAEALKLTRAAKEAGADAALLITPYYNKPTQAGLYAHYKAIAEAVEIPLIIYNCPGRTGVSIAPETVIRLAEVKNIAAVKDATGNLDWTSEVCGGCDVTVLSGDDSLAMAHMATGAKGLISVLANIAPRATADLIKYCAAGDYTRAREIHLKYFKLMKALFIESNPIPVKAAAALMGLIGPEIRLPLVEIGEANKAKLKEELQRVGLI